MHILKGNPHARRWTDPYYNSHEDNTDTFYRYLAIGLLAFCLLFPAGPVTALIIPSGIGYYAYLALLDASLTLVVIALWKGICWAVKTLFLLFVNISEGV